MDIVPCRMWVIGMNDRRIEQYIPKAMEVIEKEFITLEEKTISNVYSGYIATFGASIIQSGLLPTIVFFNNENADTEGDRRIILHLIESVLDVEQDNLYHDVVDKKIRKEDIIHVTAALKLALRTFPLNKE